MPPYAWLTRNELRTDNLGRHLKALRAVGVPYTDDMIAHASADAYGQTAPDTTFAEGVVARYGQATNVRPFAASRHGAVTEMDALVAYLQTIGRLTDTAFRQAKGG